MRGEPGHLKTRMSLAWRLVLLGLAAVLLIAGVGGWILLRQNIHDVLWRSFEQHVGERAERVAGRFQLDNTGLSVVYAPGSVADEFSPIFSGWYWQLDGEGVRLRSRSLWDTKLPPIPLDAGRTSSDRTLVHAVGPLGQSLAGRAYPVQLGDKNFVLQVLGSTQELENDLFRMDQLLSATLLTLIVVMVVLTLLQVRLGLHPLRRLHQTLSAIKAGSHNRLGGGYGPDLDPLAVEFDEILERNARIVERARSHAADLAHALKKPLAVLGIEASTKGKVSGHQITLQIQTMTRLIDRHLARAGSGAGDMRRFDMGQRLEVLLGLMHRLHGTKNLEWVIHQPAALLWSGEVTDFEEMVGNLLDNAGKWARSRVEVTLERSASEGVVLVVEDDGPGLTEAQIAEAAQRNRRFDETTEGTGLGLAITADIAETYGGSLRLDRSHLGGLRVRLVLAD